MIDESTGYDLERIRIGISLVKRIIKANKALGIDDSGKGEAMLKDLKELLKNKTQK